MLLNVVIGCWFFFLLIFLLLLRDTHFIYVQLFLRLSECMCVAIIDCECDSDIPTRNYMLYPDQWNRYRFANDKRHSNYFCLNTCFAY